jgi:hypothetical protein
MVYFLEITDIWQTLGDFCFIDCFLEIFKIQRLVWIFLWIFGCFEVLHQFFKSYFLLILNFTNAALSKMTFRSMFVS